MYPALHDDLSVTNTLQKLSIREQSLWLSVTAFLYAFCITKRNFFTVMWLRDRCFGQPLNSNIAGEKCDAGKILGQVL